MNSFFDECYDMVKQIPIGRVATYGQIARLIGHPQKARYVGFAMHASPGMAQGVPCHRVVFSDGSLAPAFAFGGENEQRRMLKSEGIVFTDNGKVNLKQSLWEV